jgi:hypothetical protein
VTVLPEPLKLPPLAIHVTAALELPVTVAVKSCEPPAPTVGDAGLMVRTVGVTVTVDDALRVGSEVLVAVTVYIPPATGAVQFAVPPAPGVIVPAVAVHATVVTAECVTEAVKVRLPPAGTVVVAGSIDTTVGVTVTAAVPFLSGSWVLVAVTVYEPPVAGAVHDTDRPDP